ncbi:MAG: glycosyltransferase family 4 protein [Oscillochloris sp.]|nr:glycosyltransferase family 4 protein [Oscillochloris sp.]
MLRVGYYLAAVPQGTAGGVGPYATRIIENLIEQPGAIAYHLLIASAQADYARQLQARFPQRDLTWSIIRPLRPLTRLLRPLELASVLGPGRAVRASLAALNSWEWQAARYHLDLIHCPSHVPGALYWRTPTIVTMHDVQELHFPEFFTPAERFARAGLHWAALEAAHRVVVSYAHIKADLVRYFRLPPAKIAVCPIPISESWLSPTADVAEVLAGYGLAPGFLFYPAQTWPHKNHLGLLRALAALRADGLAPTLICTGHQTEHMATIAAEVAVLGLQGQVRFLGLVPPADLVALYQSCRAVVVPTLYEAGSFPVIEAIMLGAAVICARVTSLPATIGAAEFTFDPADPLDIAARIRQTLSDEAFFQRNLANSRQRRAAFAETPRQSAAAFEALYRSLALTQE